MNDPFDAKTRDLEEAVADDDLDTELRKLIEELKEANATIAMLAQKVADQKEIIRKLTS